VRALLQVRPVHFFDLIGVAIALEAAVFVERQFRSPSDSKWNSLS
jgi:hypothetical protein